MKGWLPAFFYSNWFYGCCVVALSCEASLQQGFALNRPLYYVVLFCATVVYYTRAYTHDKGYAPMNERSRWYLSHKKLVLTYQWQFGLMGLLSGIFLLLEHGEQLLQMNAEEWGLAAIFPLLAMAYYGTLEFGGRHVNLRSLGLLKPFVIGLIWAGVVTIYPLLFQALESGVHYAPGQLGCWFFVKNFVFISILCILFDIKDYAADHNAALKTFVVRWGLRKTLFGIILPMTLLSFAAFLRFTIDRQMGWERILINSIPFLMLIIVSWSMQRRKSILYYLAIIDGLMLLKAACGIIGMNF